MSPDLWQAGCERLAAALPEHQFNTWIRPLQQASITLGTDDAVVSVQVQNRFKLDWIRAQYAGLMEAVLSDVAGKPVRLELALAPRENEPRSEHATRFAARQGAALALSGVAAATSALEGALRTDRRGSPRTPPAPALSSPLRSAGAP